MRFNKKLNKEKGSVLVLAIIVLSLSSIAIMTISSQINNQIKFNQKVYSDMKYKYIAESGVENSIYDIQKQIENKKLRGITSKSKKNHKNCPKVKYKNDGTPEIGQTNKEEDTFNYLIYKDILKKEITTTHQSALFESLKPFFGTENILWSNFNDLWRLSGFMNGGYTSYFNEFKNTVDEFIDKIDKVILQIQNMNKGTSEQKDKAINGLNHIKESLIEIKCRLGLPIDEVGDIEIDIPTYTYYIEDNQLKYEKDKSSKTISIKDSHEIEIDIISYSAEESKSIDEKKYTIKSKVKFILDDLNSIKYEIISYEQQRN